MYGDAKKMNFEHLLESVKSGMNGKSNYQKIVICHLSKQENFADTKQNIAKTLQKAYDPNNNYTNAKEQPLSHFVHNCVWRVLTNKGFIVRLDLNTYKLTIKLSPTQANEISKVCKESLRK